MFKRLEHTCVPVTARLVDAMRSLELSGVEISLLTDAEGRLAGIVTDGDIRRALLKGATLESPVGPHMVREFTRVSPDAGRAEVLDLMQARTLEQIPVVDAEGKLAGLHLLHELVGATERPNWAVIMAGGKGVRLRPITEHLPKPMIPVAGRPILERLVLHLVGCGIRRVFLSINYLGHIVEQHFGDGSRFGCRIEYLREEQPLGTGGALGLLSEPPTAPLLVMNGDVVTQVDLGAMLDFHERGGHKATMGVRVYSHTVPFGCVETMDGRVTELVEKPDLTRLINTGIYVLDPPLLGRVPCGRNFPITELFTDCLQRGESVGAYEMEADWIDVGQREQLKQAREGAA